MAGRANEPKPLDNRGPNAALRDSTTPGRLDAQTPQYITGLAFITNLLAVNHCSSFPVLYLWFIYVTV